MFAIRVNRLAKRRFAVTAIEETPVIRFQTLHQSRQMGKAIGREIDIIIENHDSIFFYHNRLTQNPKMPEKAASCIDGWKAFGRHRSNLSVNIDLRMIEGQPKRCNWAANSDRRSARNGKLMTSIGPNVASGSSTGLGIMAAHPELIVQEEVFRKILSDTAGALRAAKTDVKHLLPEFLRLILLYSSGHLERLMRISPNSPRILVAVALEQVLRIITQPPSRGSWSPTLTDKQLLEIIELVLERVIERPEWVGSDRLIQLTLEAIYTAIGELKRDQQLPFETISFLVGAGLDAVGQRRQLVLEVVKPDGGKEQMVLQYALGEIFIELYDEQSGTSAAWTLTEAETLQTILESCLVVLATGPADQETVDELLSEIPKAAEAINNNLTFALEDLTEALENV